MKNPVMTSSGCYGYGLSYTDFYLPALLGALVVKGLYCEMRKGNPPPRIVETPAGMLNSVGLEGPGVDGFIRCYLPKLREYGATVIANVAGRTVEEYEFVARRLSEAEGLSGLELNVSCANVEQGGWHSG